MKGHQPLSKRIYKYKKPSMRFFCPLCNTERAFTYQPRLSRKNYIQVAVSGLFLTVVTYPLIKAAAFCSIFFVLGVAEFAVRTLFRKEIPCPHCGFDASWYKRDVKMARKKVKEFWQEKGFFKEEAASGQLK